MLQDIKKLPLNQGQTLAAEGLFEFLMGPDKQIRISGPGGVGKTFLMGHLIDEIIPMYFDACKLVDIEPLFYSIAMTATTNKAAEVLSKQTGRPTETVHTFFNLKVTENYIDGSTTLSRTKNWYKHEGKIIFIDESSMIDSGLYDEIQAGTGNCKIIYVGDKDQLAPVKEQLSPVYRHKMDMFELLEPMRTSIPELQALNQQMREVVQSGRLDWNDKNEQVYVHDFTPIQIVPGIIDWISGEDFQKEIDTRLIDPGHEDVILAYTNNRVVEYNSYIRDMRGLPYEFQPGEILISNNAPRFGKYGFSVEDEIEILSVEGSTESIDFPRGAKLEIRYAMVENSFGDQFRVPLPVNREHYAELIKYFSKVREWKSYFDLKGKFPDLRQRDARTVYKAQGSSHPVVYIDAENLSTCRNVSQVARQLYVAVSRARQRVVFYGDLADKFGGLVR